MDFDLVTIVSQVGYPIAVSIYTLVVLNKNLQENTKVMNQIAERLRLENKEV